LPRIVRPRKTKLTLSLALPSFSLILTALPFGGSAVETRKRLEFEFEPLQFEFKSLQFEFDSLQFESKPLEFELEPLRFEFKPLEFELNSLF